MPQKTLLCGSNPGGPATTASTVEYWTPGAGVAAATTTEANAQVIIRTPGTMSNLYVRIGANTGTHVFRTRKNGNNGAMTVTANSVAVFEDNTNTDTIAAADKYCYTTDSAANSTTWWVISNHFTADTDTASIFVDWVQTSEATASTTWYFTLTGRYNSNLTTETYMKCRMRKAGSLKNFGLHVQTNRATNTTFKSRKNGADGGGVITITGGAGAAFYEDTSHTDTIAAGDDSNYLITTGTGVDTLQLNHIKCEFVSTNGDGITVSGDPTGGSVADNSTNYFGVGGRCVSTATENAFKVKAKAAFDISNIGCACNANDVSSASTFKLRKNGLDVTNTISITGSTPAIYVDTTHTDTVADGDDLNFALVVPPVSGSHSVGLLNTFMSTHLTPLTRISKSFIWKYNIVGRVSKVFRFPYKILKRVTGASISFDGIDDYMYLDDTSAPFAWNGVTQTKLSFSIWVNSIAMFDIAFRMFVRDYGSATQAWELFFYKNDGSFPDCLYFQFTGTAGPHGTLAYRNATDLINNRWYHITVVWDDSLSTHKAKIYVDKVNNDTVFTDVAGSYVGGNDSVLGSKFASTDGLKGRLKDYRFWANKALTQTEINNVYANNISAPTPTYWLKMQEGTGNPVDSIAGKTTTLNLGAGWSNDAPNIDGFGKTFQFPYKVIQRTSKQFRFVYKVIQRTSKQFRFLYKVIQRTSKQFRFVYNIRARISKIFRFPYNTRARISKQFRFVYNTVQRISKQFRFVYSIKQRISKQFRFVYNVLEAGLTRISKTFQFPYNVVQRTSKQFRFKYNIPQRISKQFRFVYSIKQRISKIFRFPYNIPQRISKQFRFPYAILQRTSKQFRFVYNTRARISKQFRFVYKIIQRTSKAFRFPYNVPARISKQFRFKYGILVRTSKQFRFVYNIVQRISKQFRFVYNVQSAIARVSKQFRFVYNVVQRTSKQFRFPYNVRQRISKQFRFVYYIRMLVSKQFRFVYSTRQRISKQFRFIYSVKQRISKSFNFPYKIIQRTSKQFRFKYKTIQRTSKTFRFPYLILVRVSKTFSFIYYIRIRVSKQFRFVYSVESIFEPKVKKILSWIKREYSISDPSQP